MVVYEVLSLSLVLYKNHRTESINPFLANQMRF